MSLPAPSYSQKIDLHFTGELIDTVVLKTTGSPITHRTVIKWNDLFNDQQAALNKIVALYGGTFPLAAPTAGYQVIRLGSAEETGYVSGGTRKFYISIHVDGVLRRLTFQENTVTTRTAIVNALNSKLSGVATVSVVDNNIVITSDTTGNGSIVIVSREGDLNLFSHMQQFRKWYDPVPGADTAVDALILNHISLPTQTLPAKEPLFSSQRQNIINRIATSDLPFLRFLDTVGDGSGTKLINKDFSTGSPGTTIVRFTPPPGTVAIVNTLNVHYSDSGAFTFDGFGANPSALTNGVIIKATIDGNTYDFTDGVPIRKNSDWQHIASGTLLNVWANPGDTLLAQLAISSFGRPVILIADRGDELFAELSDDLSFLDDFHIVAHGFL